MVDIWVEDQINYTLMPSLELRALIKVAIAMWNEDDIRALTARFTLIRIPGRVKEWQVTDKLIEKVQALPLPESLKKKVSDFIRPISLEIFKWVQNQDRFLPENDTRFVSESLSKLCWTSQGTIDKRKTVEALIRDENLDITERYILACNCCLENDILRLWNKVPEFNRKLFYSQENQRDIKQERLAVFWTYNVMEGMSNICRGINPTCFPYQFRNAVKNGNRVATEYFFHKISSEEREKSLVICAEEICHPSFYTIRPSKPFYADILCFLLSQMNEEKQFNVFKKYPYQVLKCLLDWPWQGFFVETAKRVVAFLDENEFYLLVGKITDKIMYDIKDYNYQKLFREFWQLSPETLKKGVLHQYACSFSLFDLLGIKNKESIKLVLEAATTSDREKFIFSESGINSCKSLVYAGEMDLLKFFVEECISSKEVMIKFREGFEEHIIQCRLEEEKDMEPEEEEDMELGEEEDMELGKEKDMWSPAFQLLDDLIEKIQ